MADPKHIRRASLDDVTIIYEVIKENPLEVLPRSIPDLMANFDRFFVYDDGRVRGVISWQVLPILNIENPERILEVMSFSVRKRHQKKGIGSLLLEHVVGQLKQFRPDRIVVLTFHPAFFKHHGFAEISKQAILPKIYLGCINCTKYKSPLTCPEVAMELVMNGEKKGKRRGAKTPRKPGKKIG
jgi:N-acetylglutamate synthase-like GNAT family acetyltransferase